MLFNYGTFRNIFNAQAKAREFCAYYTLIFPYNNSWGTNKSILWAEWNTFNKTFESSLNLRALFFGIIKTKLWSTVELKLSPITQTNKFRNCSAFDCPKFLLFFLPYFLLSVGNDGSQHPRTCANRLALIKIYFTLRMRLCDQQTWPGLYNLCLQLTTVRSSCFFFFSSSSSAAFVIFLSRPMKTAHGTWRGRRQPQNPDYVAVYFKFN